MKSPVEMNVIQIELTNGCIHKCSNCTRFCGHHQKQFFMDFDTFKQAVDSLRNYPNMIGIMGGEPTIHPEFEKFIDYYSSVIPQKKHKFRNMKNKYKFLQPVKKFVDYRNTHLIDSFTNRHGLWTSLGRKYYENFEKIQDVFPFQCINDHSNPGLHQALLITRKELGIPDDDWYKLRDKCWIQNLWSASITPKGAFFCEIAAALDMLFDGPGGWPVEPGWWKRKPEEFGDQLQWCELCSAALAVPRNMANEEKDIISPVLEEKLKTIGSPKVKKGEYILFRPESYDSSQYEINEKIHEWYLPDGDASQRIAHTNNSIFPREINIFKNSSFNDDWSAFDHIVTEEQFAQLQFSDWCIVINNGDEVGSDIVAIFKDTVLNPGCFYFYAPGQKIKASDPGKIISDSVFFMFNRNALALKNTKQIEIGLELLARWEKDKIVHLDDYPDFSGDSYIVPEPSLMYKIYRHSRSFAGRIKRKLLT